MKVYVEIEPEILKEVEVVSLAEHDKQVRNEVCEEIKNIFKEHCIPASMTIKQEELWAILDQIQGETK